MAAYWEGRAPARPPHGEPPETRVRLRCGTIAPLGIRPPEGAQLVATAFPAAPLASAAINCGPPLWKAAILAAHWDNGHLARWNARKQNHPKPTCDYGAEQSHPSEWSRAIILIYLRQSFQALQLSFPFSILTTSLGLVLDPPQLLHVCLVCKTRLLLAPNVVKRLVPFCGNSDRLFMASKS